MLPSMPPILSIVSMPSVHQNANSAGNDVVIIDVDDTYAEPDIPGSTFELDEVQKGIVYSLAVHHIGGKDNFEILQRLCRKDKQLLETGVKLAKEDHLLIKFRQEFIIFSKIILPQMHMQLMNSSPPSSHTQQCKPLDG